MTIRYSRWFGVFGSLAFLFCATAGAADLVPADPLETKVDIDAATLKDLKLQGVGDLIVADSFGPFLMLGRNKDARDSRQLWSLKEGKSIGKIAGKYEIEKPFALSPSGKYFAGWRGFINGDKIAVFDTAKGKPWAELKNPDRVEDLHFLADDRLVAISKDNATIWDVAGKKITGNIKLKGRGPFGPKPVFSPQGRVIVIMNKNIVGFYDTSGNEIASLACPKIDDFFGGDAVAAAYNPDGKSLAVYLSCVRKQGFVLLDVSNGELRGPYEVKGAKPNDRQMEWSLDGSALLISGKIVADAESGKVLWEFPEPGKNAAPPGIPPRGARVIAGPLPSPKLFSSSQGICFIDSGNGNFESKIIEQDRDAIAQMIKTARADVAVSNAESAKADPAKPGGPAPDRAKGSLTAVKWPKLTETNLAGVKSTKKPDGKTEWTARPDPPSGEITLQPGPIQLNQKTASIDHFCFSPSSGRLFVDILPEGVNALPDFMPEQMRAQRLAGVTSKTIEVYNLGEGLHERTIKVEFPARLLTGDAKWIALTDMEQGERVDIITVEKGESVAAFKPFEKDLSSHKVTLARFVGDSKLLTSNGTRFVVWNIPDCKPVAQFLASPNLAEVSPGGKLLAIAEQDMVYVLQADTLSPVGKLPLPRNVDQIVSHEPKALAFHPGGSTLAVFYLVSYVDKTTGAYIATWDLATGKEGTGTLVRNFLMPPAEKGALEFVGKEHFLVNHSQLVIAGRDEAAWSFTSMHSNKHAAVQPDARHWYIAQTDPFKDSAVLVSADISRSKIFDLVKTIDEAPDVVLKPGSEVSVSVQIGEGQEQAQKTLETKLAQQGFKVVPSAKAVLTITTAERPTGKTKTYREMGAPRIPAPRIPDIRNKNKGGAGGAGGAGGEVVNIMETTVTGKLTIDGKALWERHASFVNDTMMHVLVLPPGEKDAGPYLAKKVKQQVASWAGGMVPPKRIVKTADGYMALPGPASFSGKGLEVSSPILTIPK